jgi:hypothetical protein
MHKKGSARIKNILYLLCTIITTSLYNYYYKTEVAVFGHERQDGLQPI